MNNSGISHNISELVLVRHGETAGESSIRYYGATDIPLSDLGRQQMMRAGDALRGIHFRAVITSPLKRSREGASLVLNGYKTADVVVEGFREIDFGDWEGLTADEIAERHPELYHEWRVHGRLEGFPGGEKREDFYSRIAVAAEDVFSDIGLPVLAVLHKGVIRGILSHLLGVPPGNLADQRIELGSIHRLRKLAAGWELVVENETAHLGELRMEHS